MAHQLDDVGPLDRVLVYAAADGSGRTKTIPWATTLPAALEVDLNGTTFTLVADSRVVDTTKVEQEYTAMRVRAWNATRGSKEAA